MSNKEMDKSKREKIKVVMGCDIGDGDSVAFMKQIAGKDNALKPLYLHKSRDQQVIKSAVAKSSRGIIIIGEDVVKQQEFVINFKRSPKNWNNKSSLGVEYRQHMFDYIRGVSEAILQNGSNRSGIIENVIIQDGKGDMHWKKDEILLVVGCPASVIWKGKEMREQYEELISEATGISNVIVTEESRAAAFSLLEDDNLRKKINLQTGVLVLDFGSSTADATYILPGKKAVNISWELGAAQVENAMLEYILQSDKARRELAKKAKMYDKEKILPVRCSHAVFQLRMDKEDYFDKKLGENSREQTVSLPMMDEDGDPLCDEYGEPETLSLTYRVTDEMMQYALTGYKSDVKKDGQVVNHGTWVENCWQFLNDVKQTLEREKLSVQTVVVTGGASQMPITVELSKKAFPGKVIPSDTPSHSVVRGLVTVGYNELKVPEIHHKAMADIKSAAKKNIDEMIEKTATGLAGKAYDAAVSAVDGLTASSDYHDFWERGKSHFKFDTNVGEVTRKVNAAITNSLNRNVKGQIASSVKTWMSEDDAAIVRCINEASKQLYADKTMENMIRISQVDVETIKISLPDISLPDVPRDANLIGKILGFILSAVLFAVLAFLAMILPVIGPIFVTVVGFISSEILLEKLMEYENFPISGGAIRGAVRRMKKDREDKMGEMKANLLQPLREAFTEPRVYGKDFENYYKMLMETAEKAFDKILLKAEDDC